MTATRTKSLPLADRATQPEQVVKTRAARLVINDEDGSHTIRGREIPDGLFVEAALAAEQVIAEWGVGSRQPIDLVIELFAIFQGPDVQQHPEG